MANTDAFSTTSFHEALPPAISSLPSAYKRYETSAVTRPVGLASIRYVKDMCVSGDILKSRMPVPALLMKHGEVKFLDNIGAVYLGVFMALSRNVELVFHVFHSRETLRLLVTTKWPRPLKVVVAASEAYRLLSLIPLHGNKLVLNVNPAGLTQAVHVADSPLVCPNSTVITIALNPYAAFLLKKITLKDFLHQPDYNKIQLTLAGYDGRSKLFTIAASPESSLDSATIPLAKMHFQRHEYSFLRDPSAVVLPTQVFVRPPYGAKRVILPDIVLADKVEGIRLPSFGVVAAFLHNLVFTNAKPTADYHSGDHYLVSLVGSSYLYYTTGYVSSVSRIGKSKRLQAHFYKSSYKGPPFLCLTLAAFPTMPALPLAEIGPYGAIPATVSQLMLRFTTHREWSLVIDIRSEAGRNLLTTEYQLLYGVVRGDIVPSLAVTTANPLIQYIHVFGDRPEALTAVYMINSSDFSPMLEQLSNLSKSEDRSAHLLSVLEFNKAVTDEDFGIPHIDIENPPEVYKRRDRFAPRTGGLADYQIVRELSDDESVLPDPKRLYIVTEAVEDDEPVRSRPGCRSPGYGFDSSDGDNTPSGRRSPDYDPTEGQSPTFHYDSADYDAMPEHYQPKEEDQDKTNEEEEEQTQAKRNKKE